jgi:hypothetical protein
MHWAGAALAYGIVLAICGAAALTMVAVLKHADRWLKPRTQSVASGLLLIALFLLLLLGGWLPASLYLAGRYGARQFRRTFAFLLLLRG